MRTGEYHVPIEDFPLEVSEANVLDGSSYEEVVSQNYETGSALSRLLDETYVALVDESSSLRTFELALAGLFECLYHLKSTLDVQHWREMIAIARQHPIFGVLQRDPLTSYAFHKPRGYDGDAVLMDMIYGVEFAPTSDTLTRKLSEHILSFTVAEAVRVRQWHVCHRIEELTNQRRDAAIMAVGAGHLREAEICYPLREGRISHFLAVDSDPKSLDRVREDYGHLGVTTLHKDARALVEEGVHTPIKYDFIYALGLYHYLEDNIAQELTRYLFGLLQPEGCMFADNFAPMLRDAGYMEAFMDWRVIYRDEDSLLNLAEGISPTERSLLEVCTQEAGAFVHLELTRA